MQFLKRYVLPILLTPVVCSITLVIIKFIFASGKYTGLFLRGLMEIVLKNV